MGIPSYYKKLASSIKGLVVAHHQPLKADMLLFDFNCMIYQVVRDPSLRPFPGYADEGAAKHWEDEVCQRIVDYTLTVWKEVGKPRTVFIAIDGVVPMAKIRQQRLRRFKSIWMAKEETERGIRAADPNRWDTNTITPGTAFMECLGRRLAELCAVQKWSLSDASEPGEGEQKCMAFWRGAAGGAGGDIIIYGLDADLILLSLLTRQMTGCTAPVWLFRETAEWEKSNAGGFMRLSIDSLATTLRLGDLESTLEYVATMSLLGNDFVPHSLSMKIRDGGHAYVTKGIQRVRAAGLTVIKKEEGIWVYSREGMIELCNAVALEEEELILSAIKHKGQRTNYQDFMMLPTTWREEERVLCIGRGQARLHEDWETRMRREWFGEGVTAHMVCVKFAEALQWVIDYYTAQRPIDLLWVYPWSLPPTWSSWIKYLEGGGQLTRTLPSVITAATVAVAPIQPQEQLAMVLPLESWHFIRDERLRDLPKKAPQYWPTGFGFFSAGRTLLWECEPEIPLLFIETIRTLK